ncbi:MAG TPA: glycosyltransferase [Gaiellaceae bacterium]|nr:glycosyltransferase [Gaiellaceae bacterium]
MRDRPLSILLAAPAYWPAVAFGGPIPVGRELVRRLTERGHRVEVVTTSLLDLHRRPARRSATTVVDGATVHALGTPLAYRWMGFPPTLPLALRGRRPDVVHLFGFRDPVTTGTGLWARARRIPYVLEPLGMFRPRLRKVRAKEAFDRALGRPLARAAEAVVTASRHEGEDVVACGIDPARVVVRGNGFPDPPGPELDGRGARDRLGIPPDAPVALYVGRIADGKGIEHLVEVARRNAAAHVVLVGPDDRHGASARLRAAERESGLAGRLHVLPPTAGPPTELYRAADVFVLASEGESFGMVAAEAAAAGTAVVVSDRSGIAGSFGDGEALVVPAEREAVVGAVGRVLADAELRARLAAGALEAARRGSWDAVADRQEAIYRAAAARTVATKLSMLGS